MRINTHPLAPTLLSNPFSCWWWCKFVECSWDCCCCCCCWWWCWWCGTTEFDDDIIEWFKFWFSCVWWLWFDCWWKLSELSACWFSADDEFVDDERFCDCNDERGWCDNESPVNDRDGILSIILLFPFYASIWRWTKQANKQIYLFSPFVVTWFYIADDAIKN